MFILLVSLHHRNHLFILCHAETAYCSVLHISTGFPLVFGCFGLLRANVQNGTDSLFSASYLEGEGVNLLAAQPHLPGCFG